MPKIVAVVVSDLMFQARITDAIRARGENAVVADDAGSLARAVSAGPSGAVVDVHERALDPLEAIRGLAAGGVPVLAFGRHTDPERLRASRDAGAVKVVARSDLVERLGDLLEDLLSGPNQTPA
jgi:DNA-binding NarL/FixJ family response regulator